MPLYRPPSATTSPVTTAQTGNDSPYIVDAPKPSVSTVFETLNSEPARITDIEGEPWIVTYFHLSITANETPNPLDAALDPTLQQYLKINEFRISVTDDLEFSFSQENNTNTLTGSALLFPSTVKPTTGDMFVGYVEANRRGVFNITSIEPLGYYRQTVYRINYSLHSEYTADIANALDVKVIRQSYFDIKRLKAGYSPIVSVETEREEKSLYTQSKFLLEFLYENFYDPEINTFCFTDTLGRRIYDPYAVQFFNSVVGHEERDRFNKPELYNIGEHHDLSVTNIWRLLTGDSTVPVSLIQRKAERVSPDTLAVSNIYYSIGHLNVDRVVIMDSDGLETYILSESYYENSTYQNSFEIFVKDFVESKSFNLSKLNSFIDTVNELDDADKFYRLIMLIGMIAIKVRTAL